MPVEKKMIPETAVRFEACKDDSCQDQDGAEYLVTTEKKARGIVSDSINDSINMIREPAGFMETGIGITILLVICVVFLGLNGRAAVSAIGPVLTEIQVGLNMDATIAGVLTALPGFMFAVTGILAPKVSQKIGLHLALIIAVIAIGIGLALRVMGSNPVIFLCFSVVALAGIGIANVLTPAFIRRYFPLRIAVMTTIYTLGLFIGTISAAMTAAPIAATSKNGWRTALGLASLVSVGAILPLVMVYFFDKSKSSQSQEKAVNAANPVTVRSLFLSPLALVIMLFFGFQSLNGYAQFGWLPQIFRDQGLSSTEAGWVQTFMLIGNVPGAFLAPLLAEKIKCPKILPVVFGFLLFFGYTGIWFFPLVAPYFWVTLLAVASWCFPLAIYLIGTRADGTERTAQLSGFVQGYGYLIAGIGPLVIGAVHALTGGWHLPLALLAATGPVLAIMGYLSFSLRYEI